MSFESSSTVRCLITRGDLTESNYSTEKLATLAIVRSAVKIGIEMVQIREKGIEARSLYELVRDAAVLTAGTGTSLLVNERFDVAVAGRADGVHLSSRSIPIAAVKRRVGKGFLIGISTHSKDEVIEAKALGANFAVFGNVFATPGKGVPVGIEDLASICSSVDPFPVIAVGGIDGSNAQNVLDAGAAGYAAIRYLNEFVSIGE